MSARVLEGSDEHVGVRDLKVVFPVTRGVLFRKTVGGVVALDGVSFDVQRGRTLGIVGESGCGKTTVVKTMLGIVSPTAGEITVDGSSVHELAGDALRRYRQEVQVVFQDPYSSLDPRMKVGDIIQEPIQGNRLRTRQRRANAERVRELLTLVGLEPDAAEQYPHQFSGGQRQRIAIARALAPKPRLLLLDEPTSALDVSIRAQIMNLLKSLQARFGLTYALISHDLNAVAYMSDDIAVMYLGRIVEMGSTASVYNAPQHPYTQLLLASTAERIERPTAEEAATAHEIPSAMDIPSGCRFRTRCALRESLGSPEECESIDPALREINEGQHAACHFVETGNAPAATLTR